ncbi:MAG: hypothetical protein ABR557_02765 [Pyrinomonadaceae bacterium]
MSSSLIPLPKKIRKRLGDTRRRLRARPARTLKQKRELLADSSLTALERELLLKTESLISPADGMYKGDGDHYFRVGLSAIKCIDAALTAAGIQQPKEILDLPRGHGRVLRFLIHRFPEAAITACDLETDGVDFCTETFSVGSVYSRPDLSALLLENQFDLI